MRFAVLKTARSYVVVLWEDGIHRMVGVAVSTHATRVEAVRQARRFMREVGEK